MNMVSRLMENDAVREMVSSFSSVQETEKKETDTDSEKKNDDLSGMLDPNMLKMLPGLMGALGKGTENGAKDHPDSRSLLLSLRPFLGEKRRKALDTILSVEKLGALYELIPKEK